MAAIGAISKGAVSERQRVRSAGRAWLNLCRSEYLSKKPHIVIEHISSHTGNQTPEQFGNDTADRLANQFRVQGEKNSEVPYLTLSEELFFLQHGETHIQGDPRAYLKRLEKEEMLRIWKKKAQVQSAWFRMFPTHLNGYGIGPLRLAVVGLDSTSLRPSVNGYL